MKKAEELIDEDPETESILEYILDLQEENGEVEWNDVKKKATSGQWGRLIQEGILIDSGNEGFVLKDKESIKKVIGRGKKKTIKSDSEEKRDTSWSTLDKAAAFIGAFFILFGYTNPTARGIIARIVDFIISPLLILDLPYYQIILILALITGLYSSYLQLYLVDWEWLKKRQEKMKDVQKKLKEKDKGELGKDQKQMMSQQFDIMKMQFKPTVWIMVMTIPIFIWLYWSFGGRGVSPHIGTVPEVILPFVGEVAFNDSVISLPFGRAWLLWYIVCSISLGQVARKALGINISG